MFLNLIVYMLVMNSFYLLKFKSSMYKILGPLALIGWAIFYYFAKGKIEPLKYFNSEA